MSSSNTNQLYAGEESLSISVSGKVITVEYEGEYDTILPSDDDHYWFVIPIVAGTGSPTSISTDDDCTATFYQVTQNTYSRNLLTITQTDNGPRYIYDSRDYFRSGYAGSSTGTSGTDGYYLTSGTGAY